MKILLISPWDKRRLRYRSPLSFLISYPPLTLPMLAALVPPELDAEIVVHDEISDKKLPCGVFDVVGITVLTPESSRAYELADYYRGLGAFVVLGGYHVTFMPDEALSHADTIVTGDGLLAWPRLLRDFAANTLNGHIYDGGDTSSANRPVPKRTIIKSRSYAPVDTVIASYGCPNNCTFCAIRKMSQHICRPVDEVISELRCLKRRTVIFYDPNFFANRPYVLELMKAMEPLHLRWGATAAVDFAFDDELMEAARKAGCNGVLIGFESLNAAALNGVNKKYSDPASYRQAVENIHRHRMIITGTFILGLDDDTEEVLNTLPEGVRELGIDLSLFFTLTPTPGGALYNEMKEQDRILTEDWSRYTQGDVVFRPKNMSPERLQSLYNRAWRQTYSLRNIFRRVLGAPGMTLSQKLLVLGTNIGFKFMGRDKGQI